MENRLKYDAAVVYPRRTYGGDLFAFEVIDGKTVKPLLDEYGGRPMPPYPAYQQILYGFPRGEFTADGRQHGRVVSGAGRLPFRPAVLRAVDLPQRVALRHVGDGDRAA